MIKVLEGIQNIGDEVQCTECDSIVHCEEQDWEDTTYYFRGRHRINQFINCPNCFCLIYRWEDE